MTTAYLNQIAICVPPHEVHGTFVAFAERHLQDRRTKALFQRMVSRSGIQTRWSSLRPNDPLSNDSIDADGFYRYSRFPTTAERMVRYEQEAPALAAAAVARLKLEDDRRPVTHLIVTSCTGFLAPGIDFEIMQRCGLDHTIERTVVGFMGCNAAINALKLARHIVRSMPDARVLVVSVELCTLHLQESSDLERLLSFLLFGDGCAAALISADPIGFSLDSFHAEIAPNSSEQITWNIRDQGFDMVLSGHVPTTIVDTLRETSGRVLAGARPGSIDLWAVHPGGRTVLDAVKGALDLTENALDVSRAVLRDYGNVSSATVLFVLEAMMRQRTPRGARGCAMAFGPGLSAETMLFSAAA